jgi:hypothetical protein
MVEEKKKAEEAEAVAATAAAAEAAAAEAAEAEAAEAAAVAAAAAAAEKEAEEAAAKKEAEEAAAKKEAEEAAAKKEAEEAAAKKEAEEKAKKEAEEKAKQEAEEKAKKEAEKVKRDTEEKAKLDAVLAAAKEEANEKAAKDAETVKDLQRQQSEIMTMLQSQMQRQKEHQEQMKEVAEKTVSIERKQSLSEVNATNHKLGAESNAQITHDMTIFVAHNSAPELPKSALVVNTTPTGLQLIERASGISAVEYFWRDILDCSSEARAEDATADDMESLTLSIADGRKHMFECFNAGVVQACIGEGRWQHQHKQFTHWTSDEVYVWVKSIGPAFTEFAEKLTHTGLDGSTILHLSAFELSELVRMMRACVCAIDYNRQRYLYAVRRVSTPRTTKY